MTNRKPRPPRAGKSGEPRRDSSSRGEAGLGGEQIEGRQAVRALLAARRRRVRDVWMMNGTDPAPILEEIRRLADDARVPIKEVGRDRIEGAARTESPQGVIAHAEPIPPTNDDDLFANPGAFLVALDGLTDPRNLGAVLRSAEAAGATGVLLPKHRSAHVTPAAAKAAAGAVEYLPMALVPGIPSALERASRAGLWCVGLDDSGDSELFDLTVADQPVVIVLGAEGRGLSRLARQRCDVVASIPMRGSVESLNVAAAATLGLYEVARRRAVRPTD